MLGKWTDAGKTAHYCHVGETNKMENGAEMT